MLEKKTWMRRIQRMVYQYDGKPNDRPPPHYNNPNIIDEENYGKNHQRNLAHNDPSSYPSDRDQRQRLSSWDLILYTSAKEIIRADECERLEIFLMKTYISLMERNSLTDNELKMIGRHPVQAKLNLPELNIRLLYDQHLNQ